jgi:membrane-bound metal-dependent hydrolase YbcI (DUF457 family)
MYRLGHIGIALLVLAPLTYVLVEAHKPLLALVTALGVIGIEPLPDADFRVSFLDHRGVSHSLLAAVAVGGIIALCGWFIAGQVSTALASVFTAVSEAATTGATALQSLTPSGASGRIAGLLRMVADSLGRTGGQLQALDPQTVAGIGFVIGAGGILIHLLGDVLTVSGIRPFLPFSRWKLSVSSLRANSTLANTGLFALGVVAIAVVLSTTVGGAGVAAVPGSLSPIGAVHAQDTSSTAQNGSVQINTTASNRTQIELRSVTLPQNGYIVARSGNISSNTSSGEREVLGRTQFVRHGTFQNVILNLTKPVNKSQIVTVTIHNDTIGNRAWDGAKTDTPYLISGGTPVGDTVRLGTGQKNTSQSQNTTNTNATVEFANQTTNGSTVTVRRVTLPTSGFVVLDSTGPGEEGVLEESAIAVSQRLSAGTHRNVTLRVNRSPPGGLVNRTTLNSTGTYEALLYQDSNNNSRFEYITSGRSADKPFVVGSGSSARLAADAARITLPQPQTPTPTASVRFTNQSTTGSTVTIRSVTLPDGGFLVVHNQSYLRGGDPLATIAGHSTYLSSGTHRNVTISLNRSIEQSRTFVVTPSRDSNGNQRYDYVRSDGFQDVPYTSDSGTITDQAIVRQASDETPPSSTAPRATSTATRSSSAAPSMNAPDTGEAASGGVGSWVASHPLETGVAVLAVIVVLPTLVRRFKA